MDVESNFCHRTDISTTRLRFKIQESQTLKINFSNQLSSWRKGKTKQEQKQKKEAKRHTNRN